MRESKSPKYDIELYHDYHEFITNVSRCSLKEEVRVLDIQEKEIQWVNHCAATMARVARARTKAERKWRL